MASDLVQLVGKTSMQNNQSNSKCSLAKELGISGEVFKRFFCALFVCLLFLLGAQPVKAVTTDSNDTIRVLILRNFPPQFITTPEGPSGLAVEMMEEIAQRAGLKIEYIPVDSWQEVFAPLSNGSADVLANMGVSEERKNDFEFTEPYEVFDIKIFTRAETEDINDISDVKDRKLGVQTTNVLTEGLIDSGDYQITQYTSFERALIGLLSGEVDAVPAPTEPFLLLARMAELDDRIRFTGPSLFEVKRAMGLPKGRLILRDKLNLALFEFKQTEDYRNLLTKWYGEPKPFWTVTKLVIAMGAVFIALSSLILLWRYYSVVKLNQRLTENEERFDKSQEFSNTGTWDWHIKSGDLYWSKMISKLFGGEEGALSTSYENYVSTIHPDDRELVLDTINSCIENDKEYYLEHRIVWPDGTIRWLAAQGNVVRNTKGEVERMLGLVQDITERKQIEDELLIQSHIITSMQQGASFIRISDGAIVYTNPAFDKIFGYEPGELYGKSVYIIDDPNDTDSKELHENITRELEAKGFWKGEIHNIKKDGTTFWCYTSISTRDHPVHGKVEICVHTDISERKLLDEKLRYQASHDPLTGLISRYEFEKRVTRLLSNRSKHQDGHAMCFLDLDQFKVINDTCGHAAGDELLRQLGSVLSQSVRKLDTLARLGGDEFGVLMEHCTLEQAHRSANDILEAVKDHQFFWDGKTFRIGVSIGLVAITEASGNFTDLFQQADAACYLAKDLGRNRIYAYHPDDNELTVRHGEMQWVGRITQALDEDRFRLYAQPIISLGEVIGNYRHYEILVRMLDEEGAIIPPGAFLPAAERYNLIEKLDAWVISHACEFLAKEPTLSAQIDVVSINLSGQSLTDAKLLQHIFSTFKETGISPEKICFEITETAAVSNMDSAIKFISSLKEIGCRFALDDFGSGVSSFGYLKNLPVDYLKIDGMFVKDIVDDPIDYAMVKSINEIGLLMGMKTIAEFVENDAIKMKLKTLGVNYAQGYGLGRPEPLEDLIAFQSS